MAISLWNAVTEQDLRIPLNFSAMTPHAAVPRPGATTYVLALNIPLEHVLILNMPLAAFLQPQATNTVRERRNAAAKIILPQHPPDARKPAPISMALLLQENVMILQ